MRFYHVWWCHMSSGTPVVFSPYQNANDSFKNKKQCLHYGVPYRSSRRLPKSAFWRWEHLKNYFFTFGSTEIKKEKERFFIQISYYSMDILQNQLEYQVHSQDISYIPSYTLPQYSVHNNYFFFTLIFFALKLRTLSCSSLILLSLCF